MKTWTVRLLRSFGVLHIVFGLAGFALAIELLRRYSAAPIRPDDLRFEPAAYYTCTALNLIFVSVLVFAGILLLRADLRGVRLSNWLFATEIAYWLLTSTLGLFLTMSHRPTLSVLGLSMGAVGGIGNMGISPQILTGYPIIALVALNLLRKRLLQAGTLVKTAG